jgi:selenocysteine-specific elongation factor
VVRDPLPRRKKKRRAPSSVSARNTNELLDEMTEEAGLSGLPVEQVPVRLGLAPAEAARIEREIGVTEIHSRLYHRRVLEDLELTLQRIIVAHVENFPLEPGVQLQSLRSIAGAPDRVIDRILDQLAKKGAVEIRQSIVRPAGWSPSLNSRERAVAEAIMHKICVTPSEPPSVAELVEIFGEKVDDVLRYQERSGELVKVSVDRYYSPGAIDEMIGKLRLALEPDRVYSPAELREVLGVSRKYLIPFLEFCDAKGVTSRKAEGRVITGTDAGARAGRR